VTFTNRVSQTMCTSMSIVCALQHGETDMNETGRIGGNGDLSSRGQQVSVFQFLLLYSSYNTVRGLWLGIGEDASEIIGE